MRAFTRSGAIAAGGALLLAGVVPGLASAQTTDTDSRGTDIACDFDTPDYFDDIAGSAHEDNVNCMVAYGLTEGTSTSGGESYAPRNRVTRAQMASFIARFIESYQGTLETGESDRFDDVDDGFVHAANINKLAAIDVVAGTNASDGDSYAPLAPVTRGQMASLIRRALSYVESGSVNPLSAPPAGTADRFPDTAGSVHEDNIDSLASAQIVQGFADGTYRPGEQVFRDTMASFVMRSYDYALDEDLGFEFIDDYLVDLSWVNETDGDGTFGLGEPDAEGSTYLEFGTRHDGETVMRYLSDSTEVTGPYAGGPGAHIHVGAFDDNGPVTAFLATAERLDRTEGYAIGALTDADFGEGIEIDDLLDEEQVDNFYVNVHSADYPAGAIRGQLPDGGLEAFDTEVSVELSWFNELTVVTDGDPEDPAPLVGEGPLFGQGEVGATATVDHFIDAENERILSFIDYSDVTGPFDEAPGLHIHEGSFDENGPVEAFIATADQLEAGDGSLVTVVDAPAGLIGDIVADQELYYLNLHSNDFPDGAVRGQFDGDIDLVSGTVTPTVDGDEVDFTASGLDPALDYRITLVPASAVAADGTFNSGVLFSAVGPNAPDLPADNGVSVANSNFMDNDDQPALLTVNGVDAAPMPPRTQGDVSPDAGGNITFTSTRGANGEAFHAFVYPEGGQSSFLEVVGANDGGVPAGVIIELHGFSALVEGQIPA